MADGRRILIIEDYRAVADVEAMLATMEGYEVRVAADGRQGLDAVAEFRPDLVVLDLMLPGEVSGEEVLRSILGDPLAVTRVLVVSALVNPGTASRLESDPRVRTMGKPFHVKELSEQIRALASG